MYVHTHTYKYLHSTSSSEISSLRFVQIVTLLDIILSNKSNSLNFSFRYNCRVIHVFCICLLFGEPSDAYLSLRDYTSSYDTLNKLKIKSQRKDVNVKEKR